MSKSTKINDLTFNLELGDIITIISPENEEYNNEIFYIEYIDFNKVKLINVKTKNKVVLTIENSSFDDLSIQEVHILSRSDKKGYILQNNLEIGKWVDIKFGGDEPIIITAEITNIDKDMLELQTLRDSKTIFIDFGYKGFPEKLNIESITLRDVPKSAIKVDDVVEEEQIGSIADENNDDKQMQNTLDQELILGDNFFLGETFENIRYLVQVDDSEKRFTLDEQLNDLLDDILSTVPSSERKQSRMREIHSSINRFKELREKFSENINSTLQIKYIKYKKPIIEHILNGIIPKWIMPIVKTKKYIDKSVFCSGLKPNECNELIEKMQQEEPEKFSTDDMETISTKEYLNQLLTIVDNYNSLSNQSLNKYFNFMNSYNNIQRPFVSLNDSKNIGIISASENIVGVQDTMDNDFNTPTYSTNGIIQNKYLTETFLPESIYKKINYITKKSVNHPISESDSLSILGFLTLPIDYIDYSRINSNTVSILDKSILNLTYKDTNKILNTDEMQSNLIKQSEELLAVKTNKKDYHSTIQNHRLDNSEEVDDKLEFLLEKSIPNTNSFVSNVSTINKNILSINEYVKKLDVFGISVDNITYKNIIKINRIISKNISNYKTLLEETKSSLNQISNFKYNTSYNTSEILNILQTSLKDQLNSILETYNLQDINNITNNEILNRVNNEDTSRLFSIIISLKNINLYVQQTVDELMNQYQNSADTFNKEINDDEAKDSRVAKNKKCNSYVITKKYKSIQDLQDDNGKEVYYDLEYDDTPYIIKNDYSELKQMTEEEGIEFLTKKLTENLGFETQKAIDYAINIIKGKKAVQEGEFCILDEMNEKELLTRKYFIRKDNTWIEEEISDDEVFVNNNKMLCNINPECNYETSNNKNETGQCINIKSSTNKRNKAFVDELLDDFKVGLKISREEKEQELNKNYAFEFNNIVKKREIVEYNKNIYERQQRKLASLVEDFEPVISPHAELMEKILNDTDFVTKQNNILKFCEEFCRRPIDDENIYWLYCKITDVKLIPSFYKQLAIAFNNKRYLEELNIICRERGELSEDGDKFVDKYSGRKIKDVEYNSDEGYDSSGFKSISRAVMEKDAGEEMLEEIDYNNDQTEDNKTNKMIKNILKTMTDNMGIDINLEEIQLMTSNKIGSTLESLPKKGSDQELEQTKNRIVLFVTLCFLIIGIQSHIPSIKTKKTFPNCLRSFEGYPINGTADMSGFNYLCCVALGLKSSIPPWNTIKKISKVKSLQTTLQKIMDTIVLKDNIQIKHLFDKKREYLLNIDPSQDIIPDQYNILNWSNFLPPLRRVKFETISGLGNNFFIDLDRTIKSGKEHSDVLNALNGKLFYFSLLIQKEINDVIQKNKPLLNNVSQEPFIENTCCDDFGKFNTLNYFKENADKIISYNKYLNQYYDEQQKYNILGKASILYDVQNINKQVEEDIDLKYQFSEQNIYLAFINYCKYNTHTTVPSYLSSICRNKPDGYNQNMELSQKIKLLKMAGYSYDKNNLLELLSIINKKNKININNLNYNNYDEKAFLDNTLETLGDIEYTDDFQIFNINFKAFIEKMKKMLASSKNDIIDSLINYNFDIKSKITNLLKGNILKIDFENIINFLDNYEDNVQHIEGNNYILKVKSIITHILKVYPVMIMNNTECDKSVISKHWRLSDRHNMDIMDIIKKQNILKKCYNNPLINDIVSEIYDISKYILEIVDNLPYLNNTMIKNEELILIYKYLMLQSLELVVLYKKPEAELNTVAVPLGKKEDIGEKFNLDDLEEVNIMDLSQEGINKSKSLILESYFQLIMEELSEINISYQDVLSKVNRSKEKEKKSVTDKKQAMTIEERQTDTIKQHLGLEEWAKGAGAIYDKDRYDEEMMNIDMEQLIEDRNALEIDKEANAMTYVFDDDDVPEDFDGDEGY